MCLNKMFDTNTDLVLNYVGKLDCVVTSNKQYWIEGNKALNSGLRSESDKQKPFYPRIPAYILNHQNSAPVLRAFSISTCRIESYGSNALHQCGNGLKGNLKAKRGSEIFRAFDGDCIRSNSLNKLQQIHDCNTQSRNMAPKGMLG